MSISMYKYGISASWFIVSQLKGLLFLALLFVGWEKKHQVVAYYVGITWMFAVT